MSRIWGWKLLTWIQPDNHQPTPKAEFTRSCFVCRSVYDNSIPAKNNIFKTVTRHEQSICWRSVLYFLPFWIFKKPRKQNYRQRKESGEGKNGHPNVWEEWTLRQGQGQNVCVCKMWQQAGPQITRLFTRCFWWWQMKVVAQVKGEVAICHWRPVFRTDFEALTKWWRCSTQQQKRALDQRGGGLNYLSLSVKLFRVFP